MAAIIVTLLTFLAQGIGGYVSLLLLGQANLVENAKRFIRLMAVIWATSLFIFFHNFLIEPQFDRLPNDWCVAGLYSLPAVVFFAVVAGIRERRENTLRADLFKLSVISIIVFLVNTGFFYIFVLRANQVLTDNVNKLVLLFK